MLEGFFWVWPFGVISRRVGSWVVFPVMCNVDFVSVLNAPNNIRSK